MSEEVLRRMLARAVSNGFDSGGEYSVIRYSGLRIVRKFPDDETGYLLRPEALLCLPEFQRLCLQGAPTEDCQKFTPFLTVGGLAQPDTDFGL